MPFCTGDLKRDSDLENCPSTVSDFGVLDVRRWFAGGAKPSLDSRGRLDPINPEPSLNPEPYILNPKSLNRTSNRKTFVERPSYPDCLIRDRKAQTKSSIGFERLELFVVNLQSVRVHAVILQALSAAAELCMPHVM